MQIHELPDVTAIGSGGYFATDNGSQTTKIDYDKLAKAIIEQYSGSTLAGSAQSVKAALDGLADGSTLLSYADATAISSDDDLDSYTEPGLLYAGSNTIASSLSNSPVSVAFKLEVEASTGGTGSVATGRIQRLYPWNNLDVYQRRYSVSSGWAAWEKLPTRAEIDTLNNKLDVVTPKVIAAISDLSTIQPGEQGYMQFTAAVSPTGQQSYFTVWCTGNAERRGLIAIHTAGTETRLFANAGHATNGVFAWRGWTEMASRS